jgi:hypothetical protein
VLNNLVVTAHIEQRSASRVRFEFDTRAEREVAALRTGLSLVLLVAGAWLFALPYALPRAFAAAGIAFAGLWLWRNARARRSAVDQYALELGPDALILREAGVDIAVGWPDIQSVAIDEDRLLVIVARKGAPALELQPHYRGVGLHELGDSVQKALIKARAREGCAAALDG